LVQNGTIDEARVKDQAIRVLTPHYALGQSESPLPPPTQRVSADYRVPSVNLYRNVQKGSTIDLVRRIGEEGAILLKNIDEALPLDRPQRLLIVGEDAGYNTLGYQSQGDFGSQGNPGTFSMGFGSGYAIPNNLIDPFAAISFRALQDQTTVDGVLNNTDLDLIRTRAAEAETTLVFAEALSGQGTERSNLNLTRNGTEVILAAASRCNNTIVILHIPGAANLESFADHPNITAILAPLLPGEQTGVSVAKLLYGDINPSGKLPFTSKFRGRVLLVGFPFDSITFSRLSVGKSLEDYPPNTIVRDNVTRPQTEFTEKSLIDCESSTYHTSDLQIG
jgi:beta-glucosidase